MHGRMNSDIVADCYSELPSCSPLQKTLLWLDMARTRSARIHLQRRQSGDERTFLNDAHDGAGSRPNWSFGHTPVGSS